MSDKCTAEYFFEYKIERVAGDKSIKEPKIYFERDYRTDYLPYTMFAVPEEWLNQQDLYNKYAKTTDPKERERLLDKLPYDSVNVTFDVRGISCAPLVDKKSVGYEKAEKKTNDQTFDKFYYDKECRLIIEKDNADDHSGVGVIEMFKKHVSVAKFFFAVNFTFRKKISYELEVSGKNVNIVFTCGDRPKGVEASLVYDPKRLPCLRNDTNTCGDSFKLEFDRNGKFKVSIPVSGAAAGRGAKYSVVISDKVKEKYYVLDCVKNSTMQNLVDKKEDFVVSYSCPYCHKQINSAVAKSRGYKRGGTTCRSDGVTSDGKIPTIFNKHGKKIKKCLFCESDLEDSDRNSFKDDRLRLLPPLFMEHDNFKIAFVGSPRAGKTTYISRFFDVSGGSSTDGVSMSMNMAKKSMKQFGIDVATASIREIDRGTDGYMLTDKDWTAGVDEYKNRSIDLIEGKYPGSTTSGDYTSYPFIAEVNGKAYVSFYDAAGEDSRTSQFVKNISNGDLIGIFFIVNGKGDSARNSQVALNLQRAAKRAGRDDSAIDPRCPIAVIVTKMDTLEGDFDSNCQCLRSDYFDSGNIYQGSELERMINISSEEIKSYLEANGLLPDLEHDTDDKNKVIFSNIKYFGVSSFNFKDSIHNSTDDIDAEGRLKFGCSSKRMELPFIWMLKQFGVIK